MSSSTAKADLTPLSAETAQQDSHGAGPSPARNWPSAGTDIDHQSAVAALSALSHEHRLAIYRLLIKKAPDGMAAGEIASAIGLPNSSLSFHLNNLSGADLVSSERQGRSIIYRAKPGMMGSLIDFLTDDCCGGKSC